MAGGGLQFSNPLFILSSPRNDDKFSINDFEVLKNNSAALFLHHAFIHLAFRKVRTAIPASACSL
jgi:hypothetical protein